MATPARKPSAKKPSAKKPLNSTVKKVETVGTKVDEAIDMVDTAVHKTVAKAHTVMENKDNENLWAASAYIFFLIPFLGKKTPLTMYHATQSLGYTIAGIGVNIITNVLHLRILSGIISLALLVVWILLLISAFKKEQRETLSLYALGNKVVELLGLGSYFKA
jgi:uncharacterized membrane protein